MNLLFRFLKKLTFTFLLLNSFCAFAQTRLSDVNMSRIKQKCLREFIKNQIDSGIVNFEDFRPSVNAQTDSSKFNSYVSRFYLKRPLPEARNAYMTIHPAIVWEGKVISYGLIYAPKSKQVIFPEDAYPGLESGQVFFVEMNVLLGIIRFPICFIVTKVDSVNNEFSFSYVESGPSKGSQTIKLLHNNKNETDIIHSSIHKTKNVIRDEAFYPTYHRKAIGEVHRNIRNKLIPKSEKQLISQ
jgi:hypothetical protein